MKGNLIKEQRESLGMTQADLAKKLDTTVVSVSRWENEKAKPSKWFVKEMFKLGIK